MHLRAGPDLVFNHADHQDQREQRALVPATPDLSESDRDSANCQVVGAWGTCATSLLMPARSMVQCGSCSEAIAPDCTVPFLSVDVIVSLCMDIDTDKGRFKRR
jgi:hypothetical protein